MATQADRADAFRALHTRPGTFVLPNPWDVGSARLLAGLGFEALTTTSSGMALAMGAADGQISRDAVLAHCRLLSSATDLPLAADLEDGFGDSPDAVARTITDGAAAGLVGGSVEDWCPPERNDGTPRMRPIDEARDRVHAAAEAARALPHDFVLTARAENHIRGVDDLADTIARLQAYQEAGADVLYAPGLKTLDDIAHVVASVDRPVNVLLGGATGQFTVAQMADLGVKRVSIGGAFANAAYSALLRAASEVAGSGSFGFRETIQDSGRIAAVMMGAPRD